MIQGTFFIYTNIKHSILPTYVLSYEKSNVNYNPKYETSQNYVDYIEVQSHSIQILLEHYVSKQWRP